MPRFSVVIPHRRDDERLEVTLLSVLENRPSNCEVLVVHDGSYANQYSLEDEVVFVDTESGVSDVEMLNAGLLAACSPFVNTLMDGVVVEAGWADGAVELLTAHEEVASVAVPVERGGAASYGIDKRALGNLSRLRRKDVLQSRLQDVCGGAQIACGLFRKSVLLALGGFVEGSIPAAELDFAYALKALKLDSLCDCDSLAVDTYTNDQSDFEVGKVAASHGAVGSGVVAAVCDFPAALLSTPAKALQWCGQIAASETSKTRRRLKEAKEQLVQRKKQQAQTLRFEVPPSSTRRAA